MGALRLKEPGPLCGSGSGRASAVPPAGWQVGEATTRDCWVGVFNPVHPLGWGWGVGCNLSRLGSPLLGATFQVVLFIGSLVLGKAGSLALPHRGALMPGGGALTVCVTRSLTSRRKG